MTSNNGCLLEWLVDLCCVMGIEIVLSHSFTCNCKPNITKFAFRNEGDKQKLGRVPMLFPKFRPCSLKINTIIGVN